MVGQLVVFVVSVRNVRLSIRHNPPAKHLAMFLLMALIRQSDS